MSKTLDSETAPRAMIHKKILSEAKDNPDASVEKLASEVSGASSQLVERVLNEFGDPSELGDENIYGEIKENNNEEEEPVNEEKEKEPVEINNKCEMDFSEKEKKTLIAIYENPNATQQELANLLDVSRATVCQRVNRIDGFDWTYRRRFVKRIFNDEPDSSFSTTTTKMENEVNDSESQSNQIEQLINNTNTIEKKMKEIANNQNKQQIDIENNDVELTYKILHACFNSEKFTEEEEIEIMRLLL